MDTEVQMQPSGRSLSILISESTLVEVITVGKGRLSGHSWSKRRDNSMGMVGTRSRKSKANASRTRKVVFKPPA